MARRHTFGLAGLLVLLGACGACRADDGQCRELAHHVVEIAEAEGRGSSTATLENDCKTTRPTTKLVDCVMKSTTLAEIESC